MKKSLILIFLVILPLVGAVKTETFNLLKDHSYASYGKNITLLSINVDDNAVLLCVNNEKTIVKNERVVQGLTIKVKDLTETFAKLQTTSSCRNEECNCDVSCLNNLCSLAQQQCVLDKDCDDRNATTLDTCEGTPKQCVHRVQQVMQDQCTLDTDCNDHNNCTLDTCEGTPKQCTFREIPDCKQTQPSAQTTTYALKDKISILPFFLIGMILILFGVWRFKVYQNKKHPMKRKK